MAQPKNINNAILGVLESIDSKLDNQEKQTTKLNTNLEGMANTGVIGAAEYETFSKFFGEIGKGITILVKAMDKVSDKTGERFGSFVGKIGTTIQKFFEDTDEKEVNAFSGLMEALGKNILSFALQMVLAIPLLLIAPIGAALFGLTIRVLLLTMGTSGKMKKGTAKGIQAIMDMGAGILLFALAMILYIPLSPIVAIGVIMFGLTIRLLLWIMGSSGKNAKKTAKGIGAILDLAKGILLFALSMIIVVLLFPILLLGALIFALTLVIINLGLRLVSSKKARRGVMSLLILGLTILAFALIINFVGKIVAYEDLIKTAIMVGGLGLILAGIGLMEKFVKKGAIALLLGAAALVAISIGVMIFMSANPSWEDIGKLGATIGGMALIGLLAGLGPIPGFIMAGSVALIVAGGAVIAMAIGMMIWTSAKVEWMDVGTLGATIAMIGVEMGLLGLASPFIFAGAAAMAFAAIPLVLITGSLAVFKATKWQKKDGDSLINALDSVVAGFLGGRMPGGFFAAIKFAAKAAARAALLFVTVPPFILAGLALVPIAASLLMFKKAKWTPQDSLNMEGVMAAIIKSFSLPSDYARQKELGIYVTPWRLMLGIYALRNAGDTMASLAQGIQAFANLTVPIYGWVDAEGGGSLQIIEKRQMSSGDFDKAAYGMSTVISAISKPFAEVGRLEQGSTTGNPILDAIFAGNFVSKGVSALRNAGSTIVGLAEGVQSFAELSIPVYGLIDYTDENGNANKKLMVIDRKPMTQGDIENASANISLVIGVIARALADVGEMEDKSSGWFSGGYVSKGSKALAGAGNNIKAIAEVVANYAKLEHTPMEVVNAGTKDQKLVPGKPIKVTKGEIMTAANTISDVLGVMVKRMAYIGEMESKGGWFFKNNYVKKGVAAIAGMGQNIGAVADAVFKFATGTFQPMKVDKDGKLAPAGAPQKVTRGMLMSAANMIGDLIRSFGNKLRDFGWWTQQGKNWFYYTQGIKALEKSEQAISKAVSMVAKVNKAGGPEMYTQAATSISNLFTGLYAIFNSENAPDASRASFFFHKFSNNMVNIAREAVNITKAGKGMQIMARSSLMWVNGINRLNSTNANRARWFVESMSKPNAWKGAKSISVSTVRLKEQINGLDLDRLKILNSLMCALAKLGSTDVGLDRLGEEIGGGMKEGFELLAEYLAELLEQGSGGGTDGDGLDENGYPFFKKASSPAAAKAAAPPAGSASSSGGGDTQALIRALQSITLKVKPGSGSAGTF